MKLNFLLIVFCVFKYAFTNPCDINNGHNQQNSIQFDENTKLNTTLFTLPFDDPDQIDLIRMQSNELNDTTLNELFQIINFRKLKLKSHYDLGTLNDFIEILFSCQTKPQGKQREIHRNTFLLYVTINDVNDKRPEFLDTPYRFLVKELTPVGSIVYSEINAIDRDMQNRPNSQISFSIQLGTCSEYFEFPLSTKPELSMAKLINYDTLSACNLTIIAQDHGEPPLSSETTIQIKVIDIDDKDPIFTSNFYKGEIARNSQPGTLVNISHSSIVAYDQDLGLNTPVEYSLNNNQDDMFEIDKNTAELRLKHKITDYDLKKFNLILKATQIDNKLRSSISMLTIDILDTNFHEPKFNSNYYETEIVENSEINSFVLQVMAQDYDQNRLEFKIENNHETPFLIEKYTGVIRVNSRIDYEMKSEYILNVIVSDGIHQDKCLVKIKILNLIDKAPNFEYNFYNFKIKIPYDVFIGQIKAQDVENTSNMTYSLVFNNQNDSKLFCITQTGTIYLCTSHFNTNNLDDFVLKFDRDEYKFNVSVKIYSDYVDGYLENLVECKIQVESKSVEKYSGKDFEAKTSTNDYNRIEPKDFFKNYLIKDIKDMNIFVLIIGVVLIVMIGLFSALVWVKCRQVSVYEKKLETSMNRSTKSSSCGSYSTEKGAETPTMFLTDQSKITILSEYLSSQSNMPRMSYYSNQSTLSSPKLLSFLPPGNFDDKKLIYNNQEPLMVSSEFNLDNSEIYLNDSNKFQANLSNCNQSLVKLVNIMQNQTDSSLISVSVDPQEDEYEVANNEFDLTSSSWLSAGFSSTRLTSVTSSFRSSLSATSLSLTRLKINPNVYKLCFNNTGYLTNVNKDNNSYLSDISSQTSTVMSESMINKVFYDEEKNESLAYV
ncbi:unnamed protein product [Brachionus calyciflorus]|uniref:Cadherin domain-containing protein n=1 Tax=Brachionus calyciflorus TaxID=104777 RepID=A0A813Y5J3_9BILA|nr:unnamed protein product [Brachionus calyciflorus]